MFTVHIPIPPVNLSIGREVRFLHRDSFFQLDPILVSENELRYLLGQIITLYLF